MITDGIRINDRHSYTDFDLYIAERNIGIPPKKVVKESVPFANGAYDFSALAGGAAWEERTLTYTFDIIGTDVESMEEVKAAVISWLTSAQDDDIYDDAYPDTHFRGSYDSAEWEEDEEQGRIIVNFVCYPFRIANTAKRTEMATSTATQYINNAGQPVKVKVTAPQGATISLRGSGYSIGSGTYEIPTAIPQGISELIITQTDGMTYNQGSREVNGVNFIVNSSDRYVTANGTATATAWLYLRLQVTAGDLPVGEYRMLGTPSGGGLNTYGMTARIEEEDGTVNNYRDTGSGFRFEVTENTISVSFAIYVAAGYTAVGLAFYPRLYGVIKTSWTEEVI